MMLVGLIGAGAAAPAFAQRLQPPATAAHAGGEANLVVPDLSRVTFSAASTVARC